MAPRNSPADYADRDLGILRHIASARVGLHAIIGQLFFAKQSANCGHILKRLEGEGLIELFPRGLPGGLSYARLTSKGAARINAPKARAGLFNTESLHSAVAIAYWSYVAGPKCRDRLEPAEMQLIFGADAPRHNVPHVLSGDAGYPAVLRIYLGQGATATTVAKLKILIDEASARPTLRGWVADRDYGFAVLAPTKDACRSVEAAIERAGVRQNALVLVGHGPGPDQLASALRNR